jgi:hypothetical protein
MAGKLAAVEIGNDEILRSKRTFIHAGGSRKDAAIVEAHGDVAFASDDVSAFVHPATGDTNIATVLQLVLGVAWQEGFRSHGGAPSWRGLSVPGRSRCKDTTTFRRGVTE